MAVIEEWISASIDESIVLNCLTCRCRIELRMDSFRSIRVRSQARSFRAPSWGSKRVQSNSNVALEFPARFTNLQESCQEQENYQGHCRWNWGHLHPSRLALQSMTSCFRKLIIFSLSGFSLLSTHPSFVINHFTTQDRVFVLNDSFPSQNTIEQPFNCHQWFEKVEASLRFITYLQLDWQLPLPRETPRHDLPLRTNVQTRWGKAFNILQTVLYSLLIVWPYQRLLTSNLFRSRSEPMSKDDL